MKSHIDRENDNIVFLGEGVVASIHIEGKHNRIKIGDKRSDPKYNSRITINIFGDNNKILIGKGNVLRDLYITVGNYIRMNNTVTSIGKNFSTNPGCLFLISSPSSRLEIGDDCIFSQNITIRTGEIPHLLFNLETGQYFTGAGTVRLGNHVWIGEYVYIGKNAAVPDNCVIGACATVTKQFHEKNCLIVGNPASVRKKNLIWFVNREAVPNDSIYAKNFDEYWEEKMRLPSEFSAEGKE